MYKQHKLTANILTLFPDMFPGSLGQSLAGRALKEERWAYNAINIRDFATDKHKTVDDTPAGGGAGLVMKADVIGHAIESIPQDNRGKMIYMSPRGIPLTQKKVEELSMAPALTILCGRYEGVDQRVLDAYGFEEISIGDYVLSGGEPAAIILLDACIRLLDGVMGNRETVSEESFSDGADGLLEYPQYTRPTEWEDTSGEIRKIPDILQSGNHQKVAKWRKERSLELTQCSRPDLICKNNQS
jgi:tRNA (guanine37-N1)-methyltransferase